MSDPNSYAFLSSLEIDIVLVHDPDTVYHRDPVDLDGEGEAECAAHTKRRGRRTCSKLRCSPRLKAHVLPGNPLPENRTVASPFVWAKSGMYTKQTTSTQSLIIKTVQARVRGGQQDAMRFLRAKNSTSYFYKPTNGKSNHIARTN